MVYLKNSKYSMKFSLAHNLDKEVLYQRVLQCLSAREEYAPQRIALDGIRFSEYKEEIYDDYATKDLVRLIYLRRDRKLKYELKINLYDMNSQYLYLEWKDQMNQKKWDAFVALSETLIAAFQPDIAWLGRYYHVEQPFANRTEELLYMMGYSFRVGSNYDEYGPGGIGFITYLGEDFASRLGPERIAQSPIESHRTSWGATALILVQNPYEASEEVIAAAWEKAMDYFSDANFFAISMPSKIAGEDGLEEFCGERTGGDEVFQFWNRRKFCYEALDYLDRGEYEKAVEEITRELEECESDDQNN